MYRIDLTGKRFGNLVVIKYIGQQGNKTLWECQCDCGNIKPISAGDLTRKDKRAIRGCGCRKGKKYRKPYGESSFQRLYRMYKIGAKRRNIPFDLSQEEFRVFTKQDCFYCGCHPHTSIKDESSYGEYIYNGVDRVDNLKGYIIKNCVPCCTRCNKAKWILSQDEFREVVKLVYVHWASSL